MNAGWILVITGAFMFLGVLVYVVRDVRAARRVREWEARFDRMNR